MNPRRPTQPVPLPLLTHLLELVVGSSRMLIPQQHIPCTLETKKIKCLHLCKEGSRMGANSLLFRRPSKIGSIDNRCRAILYRQYRTRFKVDIAEGITHSSNFTSRDASLE